MFSCTPGPAYLLIRTEKKARQNKTKSGLVTAHGPRREPRSSPIRAALGRSWSSPARELPYKNDAHAPNPHHSDGLMKILAHQPLISKSIITTMI